MFLIARETPLPPMAMRHVYKLLYSVYLLFTYILAGQEIDWDEESVSEMTLFCVESEIKLNQSSCLHCKKNIRIFTDILWRNFHNLTELVPYTFVPKSMA